MIVISSKPAASVLTIVMVRTRGSQVRFAAANANLADGYQRGYHEKLPERSVAKLKVSTMVSTESCHSELATR